MCKSIQLQAWTGPDGSRRLRFQVSRQSAHEGDKFVSPTHRPTLLPRKYSWYTFLLRLSQPQGHNAAGMIMSMKNSNDTTGNRTRNLPVCSTVPMPIAPPRTHTLCVFYSNEIKYVLRLTQLSFYFIFSNANILNNNIKKKLCQTEYIFYFILILYFKHNWMSSTKSMCTYSFLHCLYSCVIG